MLTKLEIYKFILEWFDLITNQKIVDELIERLDENGFELKFPETTITDVEEFKNWYKTVKNQYFNQVHNVKNIDIEISKNQADIILTLNWEAHSRDVENPYSKKINCDVIQSWVIAKNKKTNKPIIKKYIVNYMNENKKE